MTVEVIESNIHKYYVQAKQQKNIYKHVMKINLLSYNI